MAKNIHCAANTYLARGQRFSIGKIRNKAAIQAKGDYLVFIDGDCLLRENFVKNHINLASPGYFVAGNRVLIKEEFTKELIREQKQIHQLRPWQYSSTQLKRRWPLLELPLGPIRKLRRNSWKPLKGCNFALWKKDFFAINGVDEAFVGWGYEDSEMTVRLLHNGLKLLSGRFSTTVLHIWHPEQDRSNENENWKKLHEVINSNKKVACLGISEQITNNKKESFTYRVE